MFHFAKNEKKKETEFVKRIINGSQTDALIVFCIQNTGNKVKILEEAIEIEQKTKMIFDSIFQYKFEDSETGHTSTTEYKMLVVKTINSNIPNLIDS